MKWTTLGTNNEVCKWIENNPLNKAVFLINETSHFTLFYEDEQPSTPTDDYRKKRCELEVLKEIKFMFELHSDMSSSCNGYRSLCEKIEKLEQLK